MRSGIDIVEDTPVLCIVSTEEKQLQAIEDLYAIIKAQPKYKKLKEPAWKADTSPIEVLYWLLRRIGPLAEGKEWTIDTYTDNGKTRYRLVIIERYSSQRVQHNNFSESYYLNGLYNNYPGNYFVPLDFLPFLPKRDQPLHDLIIDLVALISKVNKVPLWDEDGDFSTVLAEMLTDVEVSSGNEMLDQQRGSYHSGPAAQYLSLIKKRRRAVTADSVRKLFIAYVPTSSRKQDICYWIRAGLNMVTTKMSIDKAWVPDHIEGSSPITPYRKYKFVWSLHTNDYVKIKAFNKLERDEKMHGSYLPFKTKIIYPNGGETNMNSIFPELLSVFMVDGWKIFTMRYERYFYGNKLRDLDTPSETLLEKIQLMELKQLARS